MTLIDSITWSSDLGALRRLAVAMQEIGGFVQVGPKPEAALSQEEKAQLLDWSDEARRELAQGNCISVDELRAQSKLWV